MLTSVSAFPLCLVVSCLNSITLPTTGFHSAAGDPCGMAGQELLRWQHNTRAMMYKLIAQALLANKRVDEHPCDYLSFFCLGNREPQWWARPQGEGGGSVGDGEKMGESGATLMCVCVGGGEQGDMGMWGDNRELQWWARQLVERGVGLGWVGGGVPRFESFCSASSCLPLVHNTLQERG